MRKSTALAYAKDVRLFIQAGGSIPCAADLVKELADHHHDRVAPRVIAHLRRESGQPAPEFVEAVREEPANTASVKAETPPQVEQKPSTDPAPEQLDPDGKRKFVKSYGS